MRIWGDIPSWSETSILALLESLRIADPMTYDHCLRVGQMARLLARDAGLNEYQQNLAETAGRLHDIGKIGIHHEVLHKPGKLTPEEYQLVCQHSEMSEEIVKPLAHHSYFADVLPSIRSHHERVDGKGYPDQLGGEDIPLLARIVLVVDTCDAMSEDRSYRKGLPIEAVYKELERCSGTQFDPQLVKIFNQAFHYWDKEKDLIIIPGKSLTAA